MKYEIIYYHSGGTAGLEHRLQAVMQAADMQLQYACAASDPAELTEKLMGALKRTQLVIIAAPDENTSQGAGTILEKTLTPTKGSRTIRLPSEKEKPYYAKICESGRQAVVLYCAQADTEGDGIINLRKKLASFFGTEVTEEKENETEKIMEELNEQMKTVSRVRIATETGMTAEKRHQESLKKIKITIAVLLSLSAVLLGTAAWLFISYM